MSQTNVVKTNPADEAARRKAMRDRLTMSPQLTMICRSPHVQLVHSRLKGLEMQVQYAGELMGKGQISQDEYNEAVKAAVDVEAFIRDRIKHIERIVGKVRGRRQRRPGQLSSGANGGRPAGSGGLNGAAKTAETGNQQKQQAASPGAPKSGLADSSSLV